MAQSRFGTQHHQMSDVLEALDQMATEQKEELKERLSEGYGNFRAIVGEIQPRLQTAIKDSSEKVSLFVSKAGKIAKEEASRVAHKVDRQVHQNPWAYIAAGCVSGLVAGYFVTRRSDSPRPVRS